MPSTFVNRFAFAVLLLAYVVKSKTVVAVVLPESSIRAARLCLTFLAEKSKYAKTDLTKRNSFKYKC